MSEPNFDDFAALVRQSGMPHDRVDLDRLFEGYLKLQIMMRALNRPADLTTGLAVDFQPERLR